MTSIPKITGSAAYHHRQTSGTPPVDARVSLASQPVLASQVTPSDSKRLFSEAFPSATPHPHTKAKELHIDFVHGTEAHIDAYAECIDEAETAIIIASWNLNRIPREIFSSLMAAKRRGIAISFIVESVNREETLAYFEDVDDEDDDSDYSFCVVETNSHAKFLLVDSKKLILGSYNALGDAREESLDTSVLIEGTENQLWPFYMSIYETYISTIEEVANDIFGAIAACSRASYSRERTLLQRALQDGTHLFLLRTLKEHEEFFKQATPHNGHVTIYSPFSTNDHTLNRLKTLNAILPLTTQVSLKVLPKYERGLLRHLDQVPQLKNRATVESAEFHQKVMVLGTSTICVGSLNWLSAAQSTHNPFHNVEFSIVLQGPKASAIIKQYY